MIFHTSIAARDPQRVAKVIAELWRGEAVKFQPFHNGSWMALAQDARNTAIEVYPLGCLLSLGSSSGPVAELTPTRVGLTATHVALATPLSTEEVLAIGAREGWVTRPLSRGMRFRVIELWLEDSVMLEVLTPEMQAEYLAAR